MKTLIEIGLILAILTVPAAVVAIVAVIGGSRADDPQMPGLDMTEGQPWPHSNVTSISDRRQP